MQLRLDSATHTYWKQLSPNQERRVLGVTEILTLVGVLNDQWYDDVGTERGSNVHACVRRINRNISSQTNHPMPVYAGIDGYLHAYRQWVEKYGPVFYLIETPLLHPTLDYAGTPDFVCILTRNCESHAATVDVKSGGAEPWHPLQLSLYHELQRASEGHWRLLGIVDRHTDALPALALRPTRSYCLYLHEDGTHRFKAYPFEPAAISMVPAAQWRFHHQLKGRL